MRPRCLILHRPSSSTTAVACGCDRVTLWHPKTLTGRLQTHSLKICLWRGPWSICNSQCLYDITTDVMIFIERWYVCLCLHILHDIAETSLWTVRSRWLAILTSSAYFVQYNKCSKIITIMTSSLWQVLNHTHTHTSFMWEYLYAWYNSCSGSTFLVLNWLPRVVILTFQLLIKSVVAKALFREPTNLKSHFCAEVMVW